MIRNNQSCQLVLSDVSISDGNLADAAGGGLLVTKITPPFVRLVGCTFGNYLNSTTSMQCLQQPNKLCQGRSSHGRLLLQAEVAATGAIHGVAAVQPDFIATSAATMRCQRIVNVTDAVHVINESCSTPVRAGPGIPINIALVLYDGLGRPVANGTYDASMPLQVRAYGCWWRCMGMVDLCTRLLNRRTLLRLLSFHKSTADIATSGAHVVQKKA